MDRGEWTKAMDVYSFEPSIYEVWQDAGIRVPGYPYPLFLDGTANIDMHALAFHVALILLSCCIMLMS